MGDRLKFIHDTADAGVSGIVINFPHTMILFFFLALSKAFAFDKARKKNRIMV